MWREWEEVGMCSKEAEALRVEESQGLGAQSWPCLVTLFPGPCLSLLDYYNHQGGGNRLLSGVCMPQAVGVQLLYPLASILAVTSPHEGIDSEER